MTTRALLRTTALALAAAALACAEGSGPAGPAGPSNGGGEPGGPSTGATVTIAVDGGNATVPWGTTVTLGATTDAARVDSIVWVSLDDHYLALPVRLGRGPEVSTSALKPGSTRIEARVFSGGAIVARATHVVEVEYRVAWNVTLEGAVAWPDETTGDVWVADGHAFVARRGAFGISVVRLDGGPVEVGRFAPADLFTQDVKVSDGIAYATNEPRVVGYPWGVVAIDVSDPSDPRELGGVPLNDIGFRAHNVAVDGSLLAIASQGTDEVHLYDVSDPSAPRALGRVASEAGTAHDMLVRNGLLFGSYLALSEGEVGELTIADVSRPEAPAVLSRIHYPGAFTHSSWLSADGSTLYVCDELPNAPIRIYDVSAPAAPRFVGTYQPRFGTIPHNLLVKDGRTAYLANYKNGVEVLDVSDPHRPRLVGFYDTHPGVALDDGTSPTFDRALSLAHEKGGGVYEGAWGVHWDDAGRIVVSDLTSGLYVLRWTGP